MLLLLVADQNLNRLLLVILSIVISVDVQWPAHRWTELLAVELQTFDECYLNLDRLVRTDIDTCCHRLLIDERFLITSQVWRRLSRCTKLKARSLNRIELQSAIQ